MGQACEEEFKVSSTDISTVAVTEMDTKEEPTISKPREATSPKREA